MTRRPSQLILLAMPRYIKNLREEPFGTYLCVEISKLDVENLITDAEEVGLKALIGARLAPCHTLNSYFKTHFTQRHYGTALDKVRFWRRFCQELRRRERHGTGH